MEIRKPEDVTMTVLARKTHIWLKDDLKALLEAGKIKYVDVDDSPEVLEKIGLKPEDCDEPMAIVSEKDASDGQSCAISQVGASVIVHCEHAVIPLTG